MEGSSIGSQEDEMLVGTRYGTRAIDARYG